MIRRFFDYGPLPAYVVIWHGGEGLSPYLGPSSLAPLVTRRAPALDPRYHHGQRREHASRRRQTGRLASV